MISGGFRFHGHNSLRYVYANGKAVRTRLITIKCVVNSHRSRPRIAVVVSKKVMKSAVRRNRIRRRIYEYMRQRIPEFNGVYDIVIIVTSPEVFALPASELTIQLDQVLGQTELLS